MKVEIDKSLGILKKGGTLLYPTDTVWGLGCDATNAGAVERLFQLKNRPEQKTMICLVNNFRMLQHYVEEVPEVAYDIIKNAVRPTTIIYDKPIRIAENLVATDDSLAIRVVRDPFCAQLIARLKRPLVSTSANRSGEPTPKSFGEIKPEILEGVDYVVNLHQKKKTVQPSAIIKLKNDGTVTVIRD